MFKWQSYFNLSHFHLSFAKENNFSWNKLTFPDWTWKLKNQSCMSSVSPSAHLPPLPTGMFEWSAWEGEGCWNFDWQVPHSKLKLNVSSEVKIWKLLISELLFLCYDSERMEHNPLTCRKCFNNALVNKPHKRADKGRAHCKADISRLDTSAEQRANFDFLALTVVQIILSTCKNSITGGFIASQYTTRKFHPSHLAIKCDSCQRLINS